MTKTPERPHVSESKEAKEAPRGALFVVWSRATNRFLIEKRSPGCKYFPGKSNFPGEHKKDTDADIIDTARRGLEEEAGQVISRESVHPLMNRLHKQPHADGSVAVFVIELPDEFTITPSPDGGELSWQTLDEIKALITQNDFGFGQQDFFSEVESYVASHSTHE